MAIPLYMELNGFSVIRDTEGVFTIGVVEGYKGRSSGELVVERLWHLKVLIKAIESAATELESLHAKHSDG